jgi:hypothetical protein
MHKQQSMHDNGNVNRNNRSFQLVEIQAVIRERRSKKRFNYPVFFFVCLRHQNSMSLTDIVFTFDGTLGSISGTPC